MANVTVNGLLQLNDGSTVDLETTLTEGTKGEVKTSTRYSAQSVSIGNYADGKTITSVLVPISAPNSCSFAYIERRGMIAHILPVGVAGISGQPYPMSFRLEAGDTIQAMASTATNRLFAYSVITNNGIHAIFSGTPTGAGNTDLTHILSGQDLGQSLTGSTIVQQFATSIDGSKLSTNGVVVLNAQGLPYGACIATDPSDNPVIQQAGQWMVSLNYIARVTTSS